MLNIGYTELLVALVLWGLPVALSAWILGRLSGIAKTQRLLMDSLARLEKRIEAPSRQSGT